MNRDGGFWVKAVSKTEVGSTEDEIVEYARNNDGRIPTHQFYFDISAQEFFKLFKRVSMVFAVKKERLNERERFYADLKNEQYLEAKSL